VETARQILESALGPVRAASVLKRIESELRETEGFRNLQQADPQQLASVLRNEHPQTIALIMAHIHPPLVADVLKRLDPVLGGDALFRMARMEKVHPEVLQVVDRSLTHDTTLSLSQDMTVAGGPSSVAAVLNLVPSSLEKELLSGIERQDQELCEEVKSLMFVFEDIQHLDDRSLQRLLRDGETKELALALKVASDPLRDRIRSTMSQRAVSALDEEMEFLGPVRLRDVETAQAAVVKQVRALEETGEVTISGGSDDIVV
jgi:flagellar motor switch protein FliG